MRTKAQLGVVAIGLASGTIGLISHGMTRVTEIGAPSPWIAYEAEAGKTSGSLHGPSRTHLTPEAEASGRRFVKLTEVGQSVEIESREAANTIVVRFSIPDAPAGGGVETTLSLYVNGEFEKKLTLTSRYAWVYGHFPWSNAPGDGSPHRFFDETRAIIRDIAPGDIVRLQKDATDTADYYLVDLIELEQIAPPLPRPPNSLSIVDFGASPDSGENAHDALLRCMDEARAQDKSVWIPEGDFELNGPRIKLGRVRIHGAGIWYSRLTGTSPMFEGTGSTVEFSDLALFGDIDRRIDNLPENAFHGNFGKGSSFKNLWIEHYKCGFWTTNGTEDMLIENCRIRNLMADGVNFCDGTSHSTVRNSHLRNTGDDALATWSPTEPGSSASPCRHNTFENNTVQSPWLANGIGIYGGENHRALRNMLSGTVSSGGGILVSSGFKALPIGGTIRLEDNVINDAGGDCYIGEQVGALWIYAKDSDIVAPILIKGLEINGSPTSGITLHGPKTTAMVMLQDVKIADVDKYGVEIKASAQGALHATALDIQTAGLGPVQNDGGEKFLLQIDGTR